MTARQIWQLSASLILLLLLTGCSNVSRQTGQEAENKKETVTVALWSDQLTAHYGPYLQETFPNVDFEFYIATNSTDFYSFKEETENLPDILTVRRFSLKDVASWKDSLMDLSDTDLANTFHQSYLRSYTYNDGTVNWLPACAEIDSIVINKSLLAANNLPLPVNYQEFIEVCTTLKTRGIRPFLSNFDADYTCMEILQGLSISQLTSQKGREWRQLYESGLTNQLSEEVWLPIFERMEEFIRYTGITSSDLEEEHLAVLHAYQNEELAMMRGTGNEAAIQDNINGASVLMPYFGETKDDSWYLTYPAFQIAASSRAEETPERKQLILNIMAAMLNEEGLKHIASGQNMIPYNKNVNLKLSAELDYIQPYMDNNQLYIRLASSDMFSISKQVVQGMIRGEYPDARSAFHAFNTAMLTEKEKSPIIAHIDTGYTYAFHPDSGNPAASAIMNSLREEVGTQLLLGHAFDVSGTITAGDYTKEQLNFLTTGDTRNLLLCNITGEQLYQYIDDTLQISGIRSSICNDSALYVSSGFEMEIQKTDNHYHLKKLTINGKELSSSETYSVAILCYEPIYKDILTNHGITEYTQMETTYKQIIINRLTAGRPLAAPTDYIMLH